MIDTLTAQIGAVFAVAVILLCLLRGDAPVRFGALAFLVAWAACLVIQDETTLYGPRWGLLAIDAILLAVFAGLTWKSRRAWPLWACAFQALIVSSDILMLVDVRLPLRAFYAVTNLASYAILLVLASAALAGWRDRRRAGFE